MKFNQFGYRKTAPEEKIKELKAIGFLPADFDPEKEDLNNTWLTLLEKSFPEAQSQQGRHDLAANLLATEKLNVYDYADKAVLSTPSFYAAGLQLLGFEPGLDFQLIAPLAAMDRLNLMHSDEDIKNVNGLLSDWYDLLCTYTKGGQTLLDKLAAAGFYHQQQNLPKPLFFNGKAQPVFDTSRLIREVVYVESDMDTDQDGKADILKTEIIRPAETESGLKVPVVFTASPYNQGTNDEAGDKMMHNVNVPLTRKPVNDLEYKDIAYHEPAPAKVQKRPVKDEARKASESFADEPSVKLNDYFLARGFAAVYSSGIGTKDSGGIRTTGTQAETDSPVAVIEWLNGKRRAFTSRNGGTAIKAWWTNGNVAMTGKSYLGTLATATATSGVDGLKTIISEAAISNWYDYYREGGLVVAPGGFPGEDTDVLAEECFSRQKRAGDYLKVKDFFNRYLKQLDQGQDRQSGNYSTFWDARNYLKNVGKIKADILMVHGLNDQNVKPKNVYNLWHALSMLPVARKLILHQGQHIYINNFRSLDFNDMMNLWLSHELYGLDNGAEKILPDILIQDNSQESTWHTFKEWGNLPERQFNFDGSSLTSKKVQTSAVQAFNDRLPDEQFASYTKNLDQWESDLLSLEPTAMSNNRLIFQTAPLQHDLYLQGRPDLTVSVASNHDIGLLSFMLVDYGKERRLNASPTVFISYPIPFGYHWRHDVLHEFKLAKKPTPFKMISRGHINLQNRSTLWQNDDVQAGSFYQVHLQLQPTFYHLKAGHRIGLAVFATDMAMTVRGNQDITYSLALNDSHLKLQLEKFDE